MRSTRRRAAAVDERGAQRGARGAYAPAARWGRRGGRRRPPFFMAGRRFEARRRRKR